MKENFQFFSASSVFFFPFDDQIRLISPADLERKLAAIETGFFNLKECVREMFRIRFMRLNPVVFGLVGALCNVSPAS